jgi:hypothetical protein
MLLFSRSLYALGHIDTILFKRRNLLRLYYGCLVNIDTA